MAERVRLFQNPDLSFSKDPEISEEEIKSLYERLVLAIQNPKTIADTSFDPSRILYIGNLFRPGFHFRHGNDGKDSYTAFGLSTEYTSAQGKLKHANFGIDVHYKCSLTDADHEPTVIPPGIPIVVGPLSGLRERFITNGTLKGTGLKTNTNFEAVRLAKSDPKISRESFNRWRMCLESAYFVGQGIEVEFAPDFPIHAEPLWKQWLEKISNPFRNRW